MTAVDVRLDHLAVARRHAAAPEEWPVAPRFSASERWYHRIAVASDHEVWLLTWLPGQGTDWHDHGGSAGAFLVLSGTLTEDSIAPGHLGANGVGSEAGEVDGSIARLSGRELGAGAGRRFGTRHIHRITNRSGRPAVSVHVYGPALNSMTRYRIVDGALRVAVVERAGAQW